MFDSVMNTYARFPIVLDHGDGCYVWDDAGKKYLDFAAGIAVNALGHANPKLVAAISEQAGKLIHVSNYYWTKPLVSLAGKLTAHSGLGRAFFCNSGAEAVEGAMKLARKYASVNHAGRYEIIAMKNSFHGRTFAALTATGQDKYKKGLDPLFPGILHADFNDFGSLARLAGEKTCAVLLEPVQGEGGIHPAGAEYLRKVRQFCDERDIMLIFDEVQCGVGRTGNFFAYQHYGVLPDAVCMAKGLAGGVPIGAMLAAEKFASAFGPGDHASTFGGNPLATAAANVVVDELLGNGLLEHVREVSEHLRVKLEALKAAFPGLITDVRGVGLLMGAEFSIPVAAIVNKCVENGLLVINAGADILRFAPPLIVGEKEIDEGMGILEKVLKGLAK